MIRALLPWSAWLFGSGFYCGDPFHLLVHRDRQAADQVVHEEMPPDSTVPKPRVCVNEPLLRIAPDRHSLREGLLTCWSQDTAPSLQWLMRPDPSQGRPSQKVALGCVGENAHRGGTRC